ncbi:hypothetical protein BC830DRAFT_1166081 [Chytriomyces sp. MP71]|nr:hypothetical protein BC830DRAFT_1166081 [Chytriomyces sp. MP71]
MASATTKCGKCGTGAPSVLETRGCAYCADCLRTDIFGRFSKQFASKESRLPRAEPVCVAWSGGISSSLLIHYLDNFLNKTLRKGVAPRFSTVVVCHVDYQMLLPQHNHEAYEAELTEMEKLARSFEFAFLRIPIQSAFISDSGALDLTLVADLEACTPGLALHLAAPHTLPPSSTTEPHTAESLLQNLFTAVKQSPNTNATTAASLLQILTHRLLLRTAHKTGCSSLLTGSNAATLAARIVTTTALGGGFNLPHEIALETIIPSEKANFVVFRPLRDLLPAEVAAAARIAGVPPFPTVAHAPRALFGAALHPPAGAPGAGDVNVARMTVQELAHGFVEALQREFGQSVSTVTRTAGRIETEASVAFRVEREFATRIQPGAHRWRASHTVTSLAETKDSAPEPTADMDEAKPCRSATIAGALGRAVPANEMLCYACQHVSRDAGASARGRDLFVLPGGEWFLGKQAAARLGVGQREEGTERGCCGGGACGKEEEPGSVGQEARVEKLREQIQDFLLEDD